MHVRGAIARANQALVGSWMRQAEAPFRPSRRLTVSRDIAGQNNNRLRALVKAFPFDAYSDGRIAIETESSLVPLICSTNGLAENSYFMVLRMPSQSVAPLKALGFRKCPSWTTSTQPPDRQADSVEAGLRRALDAGEAGEGAFLRRAFGRRRQFGVGWRRKPSVMPVDGRAASSPRTQVWCDPARSTPRARGRSAI